MERCVNKNLYADDSSEVSSNAEDLFFCKQVPQKEIDDKENKWEDSEEEEKKIRKEYKLLNNYIWKNDEKKEIKQVEMNKTHIKLKKKYLRCNNQIKLAKHGSFASVLVTTYNDIYIYESLTNSKKYKSINLSFYITDFDFCNNKIILVSIKLGILKELNLEDLTCKDIKRKAGTKYKKIIVDNNDKLEDNNSETACSTKIYLMSDKIEILNAKSYGLVHVLNEQPIDFCLSDNLLAILCVDGSLNVYCKDTYSFMYKKVYKDKYFFTNIYTCDNKFFIAQNKSLLCLDENFENRKELFNFKINCVVEHKDYYIFSGEGQNQIRIVKKKGMKILQSFPYSNMQFNGAKSVFVLQNCIFFAHSSFLSKLTITNK
ncbi:hypothetical protein BDAP_002220 [Binucleata daphniae]